MAEGDWGSGLGGDDGLMCTAGPASQPVGLINTMMQSSNAVAIALLNNAGRVTNEAGGSSGTDSVEWTPTGTASAYSTPADLGLPYSVTPAESMAMTRYGLALDVQARNIGSTVNPVATASFSSGQQSFADCVRENRWDWGNLGPEGDNQRSLDGNIATGVELANSAGNAAAGATGSGISTASHATSWQHYVASKIGQAAQQSQNGRNFGAVQASYSGVGKALGRVSLLPTIFEGYWDLGTILRCGYLDANRSN